MQRYYYIECKILPFLGSYISVKCVYMNLFLHILLIFYECVLRMIVVLLHLTLSKTT